MPSEDALPPVHDTPPPHADGAHEGLESGGGEEAGPPGTVYLLHFSEAVGNAGHYLGWAKVLDARLAAHRAGRGGRATRVLAGRGGSFEVARTWPGGLALEAKLRRRGPKRLCPLCAGPGAA